jgi:hypothetical protein
MPIFGWNNVNAVPKTVSRIARPALNGSGEALYYRAVRMVAGVALVAARGKRKGEYR